MIELSNVSKYFKAQKVVDQLSFAVPEGQTLVLLGTSGSGKTTTLKMINRLIEADEGIISFNGTNIYQLPPYELRRSMGYVIQQAGLFPHMTVYNNIAVALQLAGWARKTIKNRIIELLSMTGLSDADLSLKYPSQLSGGQMQRIGIARALAANPPILLMDEPFGALDPITRTRMRNEFKKLKKSLKKTIILVTHDVAEAIDLADLICLLDAGKLQQIGTPQQLVFQPQNEFVKHFFDQNRLQTELMATPLSALGDSIKSHPYKNLESLYDLVNQAEQDTSKDAPEISKLFQAFQQYKTRLRK